MTPIVALLLVIGFAPPSSATGERVVAEELAHLVPIDGAHLRVLAHYSSQVGQRLEVEHCETTLILPEGQHFPALIDPATRRGLLEIEVEVTIASGGDVRHTIVEITAAAAPAQMFAEIAARLPRSSAERRRAVVTWALRLSAGEDETAQAFRESVAATWSRLGPQETERDRFAAVAWLEVVHPELAEDPRWVTLANRVAERYGSEREVAEAIRELGLIESGDGWQPRGEFLRKLGMVEREGETLSLDQAHLRDEIARWQQSGQGSMLRGRTGDQYAQLAQSGEVAEGMKREEVVLAWGYPDRVTWRRLGRRFFEGWFYRDREVYFVEGQVFFSHH